MNATLLPLFLKLDGRRVVLVGGGNVATEKFVRLRQAGADVLVVAPRVTPEIERSGVEIRRRPFEPSDLDGAWLAIAAAPPEVNARVVEAGESRRMFVVAVDDSSVGTAYGCGVVRRGDVTVAISTAGRAPALAGLLREALDAVLPQETAQWAELAAALRTQWRAECVPLSMRRPLLLSALMKLYPEAVTGRMP